MMKLETIEQQYSSHVGGVSGHIHHNGQCLKEKNRLSKKLNELFNFCRHKFNLPLLSSTLSFQN